MTLQDLLQDIAHELGCDIAALEERQQCAALWHRVTSAAAAAHLFSDGDVVAASGFTPSGYPKAVPMALSRRAEEGDPIGITLITGASVGPELDGALTRSGVLQRRYPYQTEETVRRAINEGSVQYQDMHLSHVPQWMDYGYFGQIDVALVEAVAIMPDGGIVPATSVGISPQAVRFAKKVIVEINLEQPLSLMGVHDIYETEKPPHRKPIPIAHPGDRIGTTYIPCAPEKIAAVVFTHQRDKVRPLGPVCERATAISQHIIRFLEAEVAAGRLPENLLPLQSGVGSVANAVMTGLLDSPFTDLTCYTEVIQDCMLDLIDAGKVTMASGTSFTPSEQGLERLIDKMGHYARHCVLRPMEISNHPEVIRRLGVIAMNTALEVDIYGHVNSTLVMGTRMMNGIGGSGDFTRNGYLSIFTTTSTAKDGAISSIVPMVSHVDHTEHDVHVVVTEQGLADLRGLSPRERAHAIIEHCAHPEYRPALRTYLAAAEAEVGGHEPQLLDKALSWHQRYRQFGTMK